MERKRIPTSARKPIKRKARDKPKRPLSAYNFFFKEERQKIIKAIFCEDEGSRKKIDPDLTVDHIKKLKRGNGNVSFEEMGKIIGYRWKAVADTPDRISHCISLAKADKERYEKEKEAHDQKKEQVRYNVEIARYTMNAPGYQMHYQQEGICVPQSGMHYVNAPYRYEQTSMTGMHNPYCMFDAPRASDHNYANNMLEQNNSGMNFLQRPESHNPYTSSIPMSYSQAPTRQYASYPHEQLSHRPCCQAYSAQDPRIRSDAYYSNNREFQYT